MTATEPTATPEPVSPDDWGRVDADGTVSVREGTEWRVVGQYADGTPEEALAYFVRKFDDIAVKVTNLEQRLARGGASASDLSSQAEHIKGELVDAAAVGDLASLATRIDALLEKLAEASEAEAQEAREAVEAAIAHRTTLVEQVEALAARDPKSIQWKQATAELGSLFDAWQEHQKTGPRLPKNVANQLWKRFRDARSTVEGHRRAFFAELDSAQKVAKNAKTRLIERAEALAPQGPDGIPAYRSLLDEWKAAPRAGRKLDDALWSRFKAAGDVLYQARVEREEADEAESAPLIEQKNALLEEAAAVEKERDIRAARTLLTGIQRRWDEIGRIFPRDKERALDDRLRKIEQALRGREDVDWKQNNPETKARAGSMAAQLESLIEKLEADLKAAEAAGDTRKAKEISDALEARRTWMAALGD